jgi:hypothetical protein
MVEGDWRGVGGMRDAKKLWGGGREVLASVELGGAVVAVQVSGNLGLAVMPKFRTELNSVFVYFFKLIISRC